MINGCMPGTPVPVSLILLRQRGRWREEIGRRGKKQGEKGKSTEPEFVSV
jgi:hypothetical protein